MSTHLCCSWLPSTKQDSSRPLPRSTAPITKSRRTCVTYRTANCAKIYRYFDEFVVPKAPQPAASQ